MTAVSIAYSSVLLVLKPWQLPRACRWTVLYDTQARIAEKPCARRDLSDRTLSETVAAWGKTCGKLMLTPASLLYFLYPPPVLFFLYAFAFTQVLQDPSEKYFPYFGYIGAIFTKNRTLSTKTVDVTRSLPKFLDKKAGELTPALCEFTYFLKIKNLKF